MADRNKVGSSTLLRMPDDIVGRILKCEVLLFTDLLRFREVCRKFNDVVKSDDVWREKFFQRWPNLLFRYGADTDSSCNWLDEFKHRHIVGREVLSIVSDLSSKLYLQDIYILSADELPDLFQQMKSDLRYAEFIVDELMSLLNDTERERKLTMKFYAQKLLTAAQEIILTEQVKLYTRLPLQKQLLEKGATLLAQWCQPTKIYMMNEITNQIDRLAFDVKQEIRSTLLEHPIVNTSGLISYLTEDLWLSEESKQILLAINKVLFEDKQFHGAQAEGANNDPFNSYLDKVLFRRTGSLDALCILYSAIARRLGVKCEPVRANRLMLKWKEYLDVTDSSYTYIDVFDGGKFLSFEELRESQHLDGNSLNVVTSIEVLSRIAENLVNIGGLQRQVGHDISNSYCFPGALKFLLLLDPDDVASKLSLIEWYIKRDINLHDCISTLKDMVDNEQAQGGSNNLLTTAEKGLNKESRLIARKITAKRRSKPSKVIFSVGDITRKKRYFISCIIVLSEEFRIIQR
ncbi:F-box protein 21 [Mactra antiquata]